MKTTYRSWDDFREARKGEPRVVRLLLCARSNYLTPIEGTKVLYDGEKVYREFWAIVGTDYGFLHNNAGEYRLWSSYSGAHSFLNKNFAKRLKNEN